MSIACKVRPIGGEALLPDGYRRCEYLESTGTQYIDTGFIPKMGDEFNLDFSINNSLRDSYPLISAGNGENQIILLTLREPAYPETKTSLYFRYFCDIAERVTINLFQKNKFLIYKDGKGFINGTYCGQSSPLGEVNTSLLLFKRVATSLVCSGRIYSFSISRDNKLQLNFIPCLDDKGKPCMFDTVSRTSYYNEGTGEFLYKLKTPVIRKLPRGYQPLDYLESSGTQWINTGISLSNASEVKCEFEITNINDTSGKSLMGARTAYFINNFVIYYENEQFQVRFLGYQHVFSKPNEKNSLVVNSKNVQLNDSSSAIDMSLQTTETPPCYLFTFNSNGSAATSYIAYARIYSFSISRNGGLQLDFQPCLDPTGKPCMWDYVTRRPFYNQNTTGPDFLYG